MLKKQLPFDKIFIFNLLIALLLVATPEAAEETDESVAVATVLKESWVVVVVVVVVAVDGEILLEFSNFDNVVSMLFWDDVDDDSDCFLARGSFMLSLLFV